MSGRSAHVRKKKPDPPKKGKEANYSRPQSSVPSLDDAASLSEFPLPPGPVGTGIGTTNARLLKFSDQTPHGVDLIADPRGHGWGGAGMADPRNVYTPGPPVDDYGYEYGRPRRPTLKTEDVSGIERSGLRNLLDKRSDGVRKGLAKTFAFRKKDKDDGRPSSGDRPQSAATLRQNNYQNGQDEARRQNDYTSMATVTAPLPMSYPGYQHQNQHQQHHQLPSPSSPPNMALWDTPPMGPPPTTKLPPIPFSPAASVPPIKRWLGAGRPVTRWNKLRKDPELWDSDGDVLVFLGRKGQSSRQHPSFRLSSHMIEATESRYLITLLREGSNEEDTYLLPPSPAGAPPMVRRGHGGVREGQLTPPTSETASLGDLDGQISYEMYFPTPPGLSRVDQLRHRITTRNVFALLYHASLLPPAG
ncbi:hypothetical protein G7046_g8508 [Stylonectria norvegica]|nr:hypothetical protein G7046_g8508 [Stylonectria norvegica]